MAETTAAEPETVQSADPAASDPLEITRQELRDLESLLYLARDWVADQVLVWETALQLGVAALAFLIAWALARPLARFAAQSIERFVKDRILRAVCGALRDLMVPILYSLMVWAALSAAEASGFPSGLLRLVGSLLNAWIVIRLVSTALTNPAWARAFSVAVWVIAALSIVDLYGPTVTFLDSLAITLGETRISVFLVIKGFVVAAVLLWLAGALARLVHHRVQRATSLTPSVRVLISQVSKFTLVVVAVLMAINVVGIDLTALAVFSGALGVGIGFGLQKIVANIISGLILLTDRSIKPGDVIEVGDSYGVVNNLGARYASVITRDGVEHLIPNEDLIVNRVINWSFSNRRIRRRLKVGVAYDSDVERAMALCMEAAGEIDRVLKNPKPNCLLVGFGDSSVDLELRFWIEDPEEGIGNVSSAVFLKIWHKFRDAGIEIPFPQRDLHIRSSEGLAGLRAEAEAEPQ